MPKSLLLATHILFCENNTNCRKTWLLQLQEQEPENKTNKINKKQNPVNFNFQNNIMK